MFSRLNNMEVLKKSFKSGILTSIIGGILIWVYIDFYVNLYFPSLFTNILLGSFVFLLGPLMSILFYKVCEVDDIEYVTSGYVFSIIILAIPISLFYIIDSDSVVRYILFHLMLIVVVHGLISSLVSKCYCYLIRRNLLKVVIGLLIIIGGLALLSGWMDFSGTSPREFL
jgi:hypothetical protein